MEASGDFDHRDWLVAQIKKRRERNPSFSLRAFARVIGVSPAHLSHLISAKRPLTKEVAARIARRLDLPVEEQRALEGCLAMTHPAPKTLAFKELTESDFEPVSHWYYFAILGLAAVKPNKASGKWIARRLNIPEAVASKALALLLRAGYLKRRPGGGFDLNTRPVMTRKDVPSEKVREFHGQILDLARRSLDRDGVESRYFGFRGIAMDPARLPKVKDLARQFQDAVTAAAHAGHAADEGGKIVYSLSVQFFPMDRGENQHDV